MQMVIACFSNISRNAQRVVTVSEAVTALLVERRNCTSASILSIGTGSSNQKGSYGSTYLAIRTAEGRLYSECISSIMSILLPTFPRIRRKGSVHISRSGPEMNCPLDLSATWS